MVAKNYVIFALIVLVGFLPGCITESEQKLGLEVDKWAVELSKGGLTELNSMGSLSTQLMQTDTARALIFLNSLEKSDEAKGHFFRAHFCMIKASYLFNKFGGYDKYKDRASEKLKPIKQQLIKLYADAIDAAYHTEDNLTIGWVSFYSARLMKSFGEMGWAVMYSKNGVDLFEKEGYDVEPLVYTELAELLYQVREYDECLVYAKKGINAWKKARFEKDYDSANKFRIRALNTIAVIHANRNQVDSSDSYFQQALQLANKIKDTVSLGMVLGNIGRTMYAQKKYDSAYFLLKTDNQNSKSAGIYDNAASASEWSARVNLARGNTKAALAEAREAISLLHLWPSGPYLRNTYSTLTKVFREMRNYDSAFYYNDRYTVINDSLEKEVATSSLAISRAKLNDEASRYNIQNLIKEKKEQLFFRNVMIVAIIVSYFIALLLINRGRLKQKVKVEEVEKEKLIIEQEKQLLGQEINSAKEQMMMFTDNIIEKTSLIEKLELQAENKHATTVQQAIVSELSQQTILTEQDWFKFKTLFEKIHPDFFIKLKIQFPDITLAEQRTAALTRLRFTTRQIASILGISADSVHKSRQRLRQRFQVGIDANLEELMVNL